MKFVNVAKFQKVPEDIQQLLLKSNVLPVTEVCLWNWAAINAVDENGNRKYKYIIDEGSSRSSKTYSMIDCYDKYAQENDDKRLTVWRDTKTDCKKTVLNDALKHFKITGRYKKGWEFNKTESILSYTNGSTFEIHGTDDEETVHGLTQDAAWLNEPYKISKETFDQIDQRTSDFIFIDWNPKKAHWIEDLKKDKRTIVIHSTFKNNPLCPPEQRIKILGYQPVKYCQLVIDGLLTEQDANSYNLAENNLGFSAEQIDELSRCIENEYKNSANEFNWSVYGLGLKAEQPNRIFNWSEISLNEYENIEAKVYTGCDWGAVDPWGILDAKYYDGGLYLRERNYLSENETRSKLVTTELAQINGNDEGIVTWMFKRLGIPFERAIICDNNRGSKIRALRVTGWEYAQPANKVLITDGIDLLKNLRVYYTSDSINLKYEQENYSREVDRYGKVLEDPEDLNNHLMDPARYIAIYLRMQGVINKI